MSKSADRQAQHEREERERSLLFMQQEAGWPVWPSLPVKSYKDKKPGEFPECGFMYAGHGPKVYLVNMMMANGRKFADMPRKEYATYQELVDDGWVVD